MKGKKSSRRVLKDTAASEFLALVFRLDEAVRTGRLGKAPKLDTAARRFLRRVETSRPSTRRQMKMVRALAKGPRTATRLEKEVPVERRTLFRDLAAIEAAGFELRLDANGQYSIS